jgi:bacterioferritin-associated ferredoxin
MGYKVDRCICFNTTFEEMKRIMEENNLKTLEELKRVKQVADNCMLCVSYIQKMIETGETEFELIIGES